MAVTVVGSINVDVLMRVAALPRPGETVIAPETVRLPGGKGANQAVAAARMGAQVSLAAAIGDDAEGQWMLGALSAASVDVAAVARLAGESTGAAYIAVDSLGENQIIVASGANSRFAAALVQSLDLGGDVLLAQAEVPLEAIAAALAKPARLRILNAAPAIRDVARLFGEVDVLIVNEHELAVYAGCAPVRGVGEAIVAARALLAGPDQLAIVTLGAAGAVAVWRDRHFHAPAMPVDPIDTVGAGDCFCGALAALLDEGLTIEQALPIANIAAGLCTLVPGAAPAMPNRGAVETARLATAI